MMKKKVSLIVLCLALVSAEEGRADWFGRDGVFNAFKQKPEPVDSEDPENPRVSQLFSGFKDLSKEEKAAFRKSLEESGEFPVKATTKCRWACGGVVGGLLLAAGGVYAFYQSGLLSAFTGEDAALQENIRLNGMVDNLNETIANLSAVITRFSDCFIVDNYNHTGNTYNAIPNVTAQCQSALVNPTLKALYERYCKNTEEKNVWYDQAANCNTRLLGDKGCAAQLKASEATKEFWKNNATACKSREEFWKSDATACDAAYEQTKARLEKEMRVCNGISGEREKLRKDLAHKAAQLNDTQQASEGYKAERNWCYDTLTGSDPITGGSGNTVRDVCYARVKKCVS